eukprot:jgi/Ulvmu1/8847/UM049_0029.1
MVIKAGIAAGAAALLVASGASAQVVFNAADVSGAFQDPNGGSIDLPFSKPDGITLTRPQLKKKGNLIRLCDCSDAQPALDDIRGISNTWLAGGTAPSSHGFSNLVWAWGQFIDHDIVATVDGDDSLHEADIITLSNDRGMTAKMRLHRLISDGPASCPSPVVVNTPHVDAGVVYGEDAAFLRETLRLPDSCMLRTSGSNMLPITTVKDDGGNYVFIAGDARVDEHAVLTMMHTVWMREHNRLCDAMNNDDAFDGMSDDAKFDRARNVVIGKMQQITVKEWLPLLGIDGLQTARPLRSGLGPDISVEFSTAAYRFGHDMVPDTLGPVRTVDLFNGNAFYGVEQDGTADSFSSSRIDDVALFAAQSRANEIDGRFSDTLRNTLFGEFGEDLGARNIYRGRDMAIADYARIAEEFGVEKDADVYSQTPMPFVGLLRENKNPGAGKPVFGPTIRALLKEQFHRIFFGSGGDWWETRKADVAGFEDEVAGATIAKVINANTRSFVQDNAFVVRRPGSNPPPSDGIDLPDGFPSFPPGFPQFP